MSAAPTKSPRPSLRALLLPREHGSWSLALEPLALGLIAAPSWPGAALALAALALFFARRPWQAARAGDVRLRPALGALAAPALGQERLSVIAIPPLATPDSKQTGAGSPAAVAWEASKLIAADLRTTAELVPVGPSQKDFYSYPEVTAPNFSRWRSSAKFLLTGFVRSQPDGRFAVGCYVYDVTTGREAGRPCQHPGPEWDARSTDAVPAAPGCHRMRRDSSCPLTCRRTLSNSGFPAGCAASRSWSSSGERTGCRATSSITSYNCSVSAEARFPERSASLCVTFSTSTPRVAGA